MIVQIKDSLRTSTDLDTELAALSVLEKANGLSVVQWYAGTKLLVTLSFPKEFSEEQAEKTIPLLQLSSAVEKVVAQSAANLEFKAADFARAYGPDEGIPDQARRGFDVDRLNRTPIVYDEKTELPPHVENKIIVRWKDEYVWNGDKNGFDQQFASFNDQAECTVVNQFQYTDHDLTQVLAFDSAKYSVLDQILLYQTNEMVDYVQPDYLYETTTVPNDPIYATNQWSLPKISMPTAWSNQTGNGSIVAAVIDTGANVNHREFSANLNPNYHNSIDGTSNVADFAPYHGSNVASIVGAQGNNLLYMAGVAWDVSLMHIKVFPNTGGGADTNDIIDAMTWAQNHGATVMNLSLGNTHCTQIFCDPETGDCDCTGQWTLDLGLRDAMRSARDNGVVAVCAAGNSGGKNDSIPFAPSGLPQNNVISVAASDQNDARATFSIGSSNIGFKTVDLAAPGKGIYGLTQNDNGSYSIFDGTSQAAPHVTGAIAVLKSEYGWESYYGLRDRVLMGTDDLTAWTTLVRTGGRLNVNKALHARTLIENVSTRARVENDKIMIGGFVIGGSGTGTLKVAIRGLGPSIPGLTVAKLADPKITLYNSAGIMIRQVLGSTRITDIPAAEWDELNADGLIPPNTKEPAMIMTLAPGSYTVFVESQTGTTGWGVGLFDMYELEGGLDQQTRVLNISTRCLVRTGDEQAIAGVVAGDPAQNTDPTIPKRSILILGKGPSLPSTIVGRLANPTLSLYNSFGTLMSTNDNWGGLNAPLDELTEAGLSPTNSLESALWPIFKPSLHTAILSGVNGGTGVGLIELYEY